MEPRSCCRDYFRSQFATELRESGVLLSGHEVTCPELPTATTRIDGALLLP